ncbi:hypothetical protein E2C01_019977 [Portunus trituberculatus]|uniref:Uncharacterized protein n=1 Tax=Portunus trituberculatus TaxID=210409 RepID=A0A5B7E0V3_PORTR|nr:hypothetical protein [Portunus trituberculatus]
MSDCTGDCMASVKTHVGAAERHEAAAGPPQSATAYAAPITSARASLVLQRPLSANARVVQPRLVCRTEKDCVWREDGALNSLTTAVLACRVAECRGRQ